MKKTLVGLALLASFLLPACQNKTSVAGSASVSASSRPISDSAVTSVPASPSVSASASTSVAPEVNTKITKKVCQSLKLWPDQLEGRRLL
jgi:predicted small secreted protein